MRVVRVIPLKELRREEMAGLRVAVFDLSTKWLDFLHNNSLYGLLRYVRYQSKYYK